MQIERGAVDGIPAFWVDAPPPFTAALVFRAGRADETLATSGLSHLVEHLALPADDPYTFDFNGSVGAIETVFWASGRTDEVVDILGALCARVQSLPLDRFDVERDILLTEWEGWEPNPLAASYALRFGPVRHGLVGFEELGLHRATPDAVASWSARFFTSGNAALWCTGPPPPDLRLPLPTGDRRDAPPPRTVAELALPAVYPDAPAGGVAAGLVATRTPAFRAGMAIAERRLRRQLRYELGLSYDVNLAYEPLDRDTALACLIADARAARTTQVRDGVMRVLDDLGEAGPTTSELEEEVVVTRRAVEDVHEAGDALHSRALQQLLGAPFESDDDLVRGRESLTSDVVAGEVGRALGSLLLLAPADDAGPRVVSLKPYPLWSSTRAEGTIYRSRGILLRGDSRRTSLVVGADGVSITWPDGSLSTVHFATCVAMQTWADGTRLLWNEDGMRLFVDPELWRGGAEAVRAIDERVPATVVVPMDRELEERVAATDELLATKLKRRWLNADELRALPHHLRETEQLVSAAEASVGWRAGVLALTTERLLFLYFGDVRTEIALGDVAAVRTERPRWFTDSKIVVTTPSGETAFRDVKPEERLEELAELIRERIEAPAPA